jgi:hypothetical protein
MWKRLVDSKSDSKSDSNHAKSEGIIGFLSASLVIFILKDNVESIFL